MLKKIWPGLLFIAICFWLYMSYKNYELKMAYSSSENLLSEKEAILTEKYQENDRKLLEENAKERILLKWKLENYRISANHLEDKLVIKEDWMSDPASRWEVNEDGEVVEKEVE